MATNWKATRDIAHSLGNGWGIWLLDRDMDPIGTLDGHLGWSLSEAVNETTTVQITLPDTHPAFPILLPFAMVDGSAPEDAWRSLTDTGYYLMFEGPGGEDDRLTYRLQRMADREHAGEFILEGKLIYRWAEMFPMWADPGNSLSYQGQYHDIRRGDSLRVLKEFLLVNMEREFQPGSISGNDPWAAGNWSGVNPGQWPAMISPLHQSETTAQTVLDARFDQATDLFRETLDGAALMMTVNLWLPGDRQPAPTHVTLTEPIFWIDIVPRQFDTSTTGDWDDFLTGLRRGFDRDNNAPIMGLGDTPATASGRLPWVVWRPEDMAQVTSDFTVMKSEYAQVIVGGRSPEVINKAISMAGEVAGNVIGEFIYTAASTIPVVGPILGAIGRALADWALNAIAQSQQDKLFAWQKFDHSLRKTLQGKYAPRTAIGAGDAYTIESWQQGFHMLKQGAGSISVSFTVDEQSIYEWGRHYRAGDQQGYVHRGLIFATYVHSVALSCAGPGQRVVARPSLGDPRNRESALELHQRSIKTISNAVNRVKTVVL